MSHNKLPMRTKEGFQGMPLYLPLEHLRVSRPVDRIAYLCNASKDKVVLDLGAMDETAYFAKRGRGVWLHEELGAVAKQVVGIDSSKKIPEEGLATMPNSVIYRVDIANMGPWLVNNKVDLDIVVAGELIEHLENPLSFLKSIKSIDSLNGKQFILTTPNATALHNCLIGLLSMESTHRDHLCILSYKTLCTLLYRAGFRQWKIIPYYSKFSEIKERHSGLVRWMVVASEKVINALEWVFPMMSFGYIAVVRI